MRCPVATRKLSERHGEIRARFSGRLLGNVREILGHTAAFRRWRAFLHRSEHVRGIGPRLPTLRASPHRTHRINFGRSRDTVAFIMEYMDRASPNVRQG